MAGKKSGKVAVITGGVRRLGRYISYFLADEGYTLAVIYNSSSNFELSKTRDYFKKKNIEYKFYKSDIRDLTKLKSTVNDISKRYQKIDILVNNSGIINKVDFEDISDVLFNDTININLRAALFMSQYCTRYLNRARKPLIVNIASLGGLQNWTNYFPYSISKTALIKLTYLLAKKLAPKIRVNAIAPGTIIIKDEEKDAPAKSPLNKIPLNRYGSAEDITRTLKYFIDSDYVTGQVIAVDGGRTLN